MRAENTRYKYHIIGKTLEREFPQDIAELRPSTYQHILNRMGEHTGYDYLGRINRVIEKLVDFAKADGIEVRNFTLGWENFAKNEKQLRENKYLHSIEDYNRVLSALKGRFNYENAITPYYLYLLFQTGLRPSELLGLTWGNVNFEAQELSVNTRINTITLERVKAKNRFSVRTIPVNRATIEVLREIQDKQPAMIAKYRLYNPDELVFYHWHYYRNLPINSTLTKYLKDLLKKMGIRPVIGLYGARHSKISVLLAKGIEIPVVARYSGHSSNEQILKTYGGLLDEEKYEGFEKIKEL